MTYTTTYRVKKEPKPKQKKSGLLKSIFRGGPQSAEKSDKVLKQGQKGPLSSLLPKRSHSQGGVTLASTSSVSTSGSNPASSQRVVKRSWSQVQREVAAGMMHSSHEGRVIQTIGFSADKQANDESLRQQAKEIREADDDFITRLYELGAEPVPGEGAFDESPIEPTMSDMSGKNVLYDKYFVRSNTGADIGWVQQKVKNKGMNKMRVELRGSDHDLGAPTLERGRSNTLAYQSDDDESEEAISPPTLPPSSDRSLAREVDGSLLDHLSDDGGSSGLRRRKDALWVHSDGESDNDNESCISTDSEASVVYLMKALRCDLAEPTTDEIARARYKRNVKRRREKMRLMLKQHHQQSNPPQEPAAKGIFQRACACGP